MTEVRVLSATGMLGSGFMESSFERGVSLQPHVIGCDAGSTDAGPAFLGAGTPYFSKEATERDLRLMLGGCHPKSGNVHRVFELYRPSCV